MNVFETSHVRKTYGKKVVLDDVNLTVREGEIYGLVGRNGAGKTTLMRVLLGLAKADGGDIRINGVSSKDALCYWAIVSAVLGKEWLCRELFRLGVSRLGNSLMSSIEGNAVVFF